MAHTPGPWINDNGLVTGQETRPRYAPGVSIDLFDVGEYPDELRDEMLANAALISAAPDMVNALLVASVALQDALAVAKATGFTIAETSAAAAFILVRAALAKAETPSNG